MIHLVDILFVEILKIQIDVQVHALILFDLPDKISYKMGVENRLPFKIDCLVNFNKRKKVKKGFLDLLNIFLVG